MAPASVFHSCSLISKECENQGCCTRENHQQCSHSPLHCLLVPSSYCSYQVSFPSRWVHLPLLLFFHDLSVLLHPCVTNLVSLRAFLFPASCSSSFSWVPAVIEVVEHRTLSSLFICDIPSHCSPCWPGQMTEGKVCSSSASVLLEMSALGNAYRSCVEVQYVQFSFSALKIKSLVWFEILKTWLNLEEFSMAWEKPVELVSGLSWNI